jgi:hypothetical protein
VVWKKRVGGADNCDDSILVTDGVWAAVVVRRRGRREVGYRGVVLARDGTLLSVLWATVKDIVAATSHLLVRFRDWRDHGFLGLGVRLGWWVGELVFGGWDEDGALEPFEQSATADVSARKAANKLRQGTRFGAAFSDLPRVRVWNLNATPKNCDASTILPPYS